MSEYFESLRALNQFIRIDMTDDYETPTRSLFVKTVRILVIKQKALESAFKEIEQLKNIIRSNHE